MSIVQVLESLREPPGPLGLKILSNPMDNEKKEVLKRKPRLCSLARDGLGTQIAPLTLVGVSVKVYTHGRRRHGLALEPCCQVH